MSMTSASQPETNAFEATLSTRLQNIKPYIFIAGLLILGIIIICITKLCQILVKCFIKRRTGKRRGNDIIRMVEVMRDKSVETMYGDYKGPLADQEMLERGDSDVN